MHQYDYKNAPWAADGSLSANGSSVAKFKRGFEISTKHYPMELLEEWQIPVTLGKDSEERLGVEGEVVLMLRTGPILILKKDSSTWRWEFNTIRRLGYSSTSFHFEAGRRSQTGEGVFTFLTDKGNRIYQKVTEMKNYFQIDLLCQKGMSLEQILHRALREDLPQPSSNLGSGGTSFRNKSKFRTSVRIRSVSQPDLNVTIQPLPVTMDPVGTPRSRPVTLGPSASPRSRPVTHTVSVDSVKPPRSAQTLPRRR